MPGLLLMDELTRFLPCYRPASGPLFSEKSLRPSRWEVKESRSSAFSDVPEPSRELRYSHDADL